MRIGPVVVAAALLPLLWSCTWEEPLQPEARRRRKAEAIVSALGRGRPRTIYRSLGRELKEACPKETLMSSLSQLREAVGERWAPDMLVTHTDEPYGFTYGLTELAPADYTFSFWLTERHDRQIIVGLEVGMPFPEDCAGVVELKCACDRFLSLLAQDRLAQADEMVGEGAGGFPRPFHRAMGSRYQEMRDLGDVGYRHDRRFTREGRTEIVTLLRREGNTEEIRICFRRETSGKLKVVGGSFVSHVEE